MASRNASHPDAQVASLRRKIDEYERWVRLLDAQMRVLERERQKLSAVVAHADAGFFVVDATLEVVWANGFLTRLVPAGTDPATIVGTKCHDVVCRRHETCETCPAARSFQSGAVAHHEVCQEIHTRRRHLYATAMPMLSPFGEVDQTMVMIQDVSDLEVLRASEEALKRSEERFRSIFEKAAAGMATVGPDGSFLQANAALSRFLGYTEDELLGRNLAAVVDPDDCPGIRGLRHALDPEEQRATEAEVRFRRKDGRTVWGLVTAAWLFDESRSPRYAVTLVQDVTERKQAEEALRESEHRLRLLVGQMPAVMWSTDKELRFTSSVGAGLAGLGLRPSQVVGLSLFEYFGTDDPEFPPIAAHRRAIQGESVPYELAWQGRAFESHVEPFLGSGSEIVGSVGIALDVTERKRAEEGRRRSEVRKGAMLETALDAIVSIDHEGRITEFNAAAENMFGHARSDALGRDLAELLVPPALREAHRRGFAHHLATGEARVLGRRVELTALRADGSEIPVELAVTRIPLDGPPSFTAYVRDLTERKQAEQALRHSEEQLRQAQKMEAIGTLAGGVAHDFNNLLTGILGHAQLLKVATGPGDKVHRSAEVIETAARRGAALTQQLLGFARKGKNQNVPVDLAATIAEVIGLLTRTVDKNIRMTSRSAVDRPVVGGDPGQLQQVILNLAVNARDAMPEGGEMVFVTDASIFDENDFRRPPEIPPGRYVVLSISDTGCGIPDEVKRRIFEPFFTTKGQGKGTGMGLAMVYGIVKNHGGWVAVESAVERGTTVRVHLPQAAGVAASDHAESRDEVRHGTGRILVVDDEEIVRSVAESFLRHLGYDVLTASDGQEAVEYYTKFGPEIDAVLIDMIMPRMGGRECFRALRGVNPDVRAVLSTGYGSDVMAQELLDEGMRGFVPKPYRLEELAEALARALRR